jgi:hypothetical protein
MVSDWMVGTGFITEGSGVHGDGGRHQADDPRTKAEALTGQRPEQRIGRRPDRKGHVSPCNMFPLK